MEVEALTIHPKRAGETIKDVFFKTERTFSYYYQHEEFTISATPLDSSLAEFLNFATDIDMSPERNHLQQLFLREFVGSYKGFQSGREMNFGKHDVVIDEWEGMDKSHLIHLGLALSGSKNTLIYEEVGISGPATSTLPHGKIDLLALSQAQQQWQYVSTWMGNKQEVNAPGLQQPLSRPSIHMTPQEVTDRRLLNCWPCHKSFWRATQRSGVAS